MANLHPNSSGDWRLKAHAPGSPLKLWALDKFLNLSMPQFPHPEQQSLPLRFWQALPVAVHIRPLEGWLAPGPRAVMAAVNRILGIHLTPNLPLLSGAGPGLCKEPPPAPVNHPGPRDL